MSPNTRDSGPLYQQVANQIKEGISSGIWSPGDKLPSERALCELYHVSQITVRRALRELSYQSTVYSRHGLGWYIEERAADPESNVPASDVAIIVPAQDELGSALVTACTRRLCGDGQAVDVLYYSDQPQDSQRAQLRLSAMASVPLLWMVAGKEQDLLARYAGATAGLAARSVLLGRAIEGLDLPAIVIDEQSAMAQVTQHLIALGHRRIAYFGSDPAQAEGWRRYWGFAGQMWDRGLELPLDWVISAHGEDASPDDRLERVLGSSMRPTAVVCSSDTLAAQAIHRLTSVGLACPSDVAVVGMGDEAFGAYLAEPLTTFHLDRDGLSRQVLEAVHTLQRGGQPESWQVSGQLVTRMTCGAGRAGA